tara:strand:- start:574 stop:1350 length:777 start_codon:yes stop_codon:yes gene_type:complete
MKNFLKVILTLSFCYPLIACGENDFTSERIIWSQEKGEIKQKFDYVTIQSYSKINELGSNKIELGQNKKTELGDFFLVKKDQFGNKLWSKNLEEKDEESGLSVILDSFGSVYLASYKKLGRDLKSESQLYRMFLTKYNSSGTKLWSKKIGESFYNYGIAIALDSFENIYVTAVYNGIYNEGDNLGSEINFLKKFDPSGIKHWERKLGNLKSGILYDIFIDSIGKIHVTGVFNSYFEAELNFQNNDIIFYSYNSDGILL